MKRRVLAILTALVMFISAVGVPSVSKAQTTGPVWQWTRLAGKDRYLTMEQVVQTAYKDGSCKNLIVATASSFPDALSGSALAGVLGCPIILTTKASLSAPAASEIKRLASPDGCELFILGGKGAVSQAAEDAIVALGIEKLTVERVKGSNREATAKAVYEKGVEKGGFAEGGTVIISTGYAFADVLSISPYAYAAKTPIVLTQKGGALSDETKDLIRTINPSKALLIGGKSAVNADSEQYLTDLGLKVYRLKGGTRYGTSAAIMNWELGLDTEAPFQPDVKLSVQGMGIATGRNFADALGAVSLLGKTKSVLLLVADNNDDNLTATEANIANLIAPNASKMNKGYIFGGKGAVSLSLEEKLNAVIPTTTIYETPEEIVTAAHALGNGEVLSEGHEYELTGKITKINATYSASFNNVSVTFAVEGLEDKPIQAYRLTAAPADTAMQEALPKLKIGDTIKVKGTLKRYNASTVEFDAGCILLEYTEDTSAIIYETPEEIVNALYALPGDNDVLSGGHVYELTGKITKIVTPYDQGFKNVTVEIVVGDMTDKPIECFRMKTEVEELKDVIASLNPDDTITVKGVLKKYNGKPEFDANCLMTAYTSGGGTGPTIYETPEEILKALYALGDNEFLSNGHVYELEGKITEVIEAYNEEYKNATVEIVVGEWTEYPVVAFRMKAEADDMKEAILKLKVGDTIKVQGKLKNFVKDGESTKEFDSGCLLIAYTAGETPGMTDEEKLEFEAGQLSLPKEVDEAQELPIPLKGSTYEDVTITWTSDSEFAVADNTNGKLVITLPENEDATANITATLELNGKTKTAPFVMTIKKANTEPPVIYETVQEILEALYALGDNEVLSGGHLYELEGTIVAINKAFDDGMITVTIVVEGFDQYPVQCYHLTAEDEAMVAVLPNLKKDDVITVKGSLKNFVDQYSGNSTKEFEEGCLLLACTPAPEVEDVNWVKVDWADITESDTIAITMKSGDTTYILPTDPTGSSNNPSAIPVEPVDGVLTTKGADGFGWIRKAVTDGFTFQVKSDETLYLFNCSSPKTGLRVGELSTSVASEVFALDSATGYLTIPATSRYVIIYLTDPLSWRAYAKSSLPADKQTLEFWKLDDGTQPQVTDQDKVDYEAGKLTLPESVDEEKDLDLPTPKLYNEVQIAWASDSDFAVVNEAEGKLSIKLPTEDVEAHITATVSLNEATPVTVPFTILIKAPTGPTIYETPEEIVNALYELGKGETLSEGYLYELEGKVIGVNTAPANNVITVTIVVGEMTDKPIQCFKLTAAEDNAEMLAAIPTLKTSDTIKVKGALKNYNGTREFDAGCLLLEHTVGAESPTIYETPEQIVNAIYALETNGYLLSDGYLYELTGKINKIDTAYNADKKNITVTIVVGEMTDKPIQCYRLTAADDMLDKLAALAVDDVITVKGALKKYNNKPQFDSGSLLLEVVEEELTDQEKVDYEAGKLTLPESVDEEKVLDLPTPGLYPEVQIAWVSDSDFAVVSEAQDKLSITLPTEDVEAHITATVSLNEATPVVVPFTILIKAAGEEPQNYSWTKIAWEDITEDDKIAITATDGTTTWILKVVEADAATKAPVAEKVTPEDSKITTKDEKVYGFVREAIEEETGFALRWADTKDWYMIFNDTNNGVRIIEGADPFPFGYMTLAEHGTYLYGTSGSINRYLGVFQGSDWRCYDMKADGSLANISGQTIEFWKFQDPGEVPPVGPTDDEKLETEYLDLSLGPISVGSSVVEEDMTYELPLVGEHYPEVEISWVSDKEEGVVISEDGKWLIITLIDEEVHANVTATLSLNGKTREKTFPVTVVAKTGGDTEPVTVTLGAADFKDKDLANAVFDDLTFVFDKATGSTAPKYYDATSSIPATVRTYVNNTFTISTSGSALTTIVFTFTTDKAANLTASTGTFTMSEDGTTGTWTAGSETKTVTFTVTSSQARIAGAEITYNK